MSTQPFSAALVGQTEKALHAILERRLAGTGITGPQWFTLTMTVVGGTAVDRTDLIHRVSAATQFDETSVAEHIAELTAAGLLTHDGAGRVQASDAGQARWTENHTALGPIRRELWGDLPAEDLAVAGRVLCTVLERANTILAAA